MDFDNGIFRTVPCDRIEGAVWVVRISDGEKITFCRGYDDVMFTVGELMKQRIAALQGLTRKPCPSRKHSRGWLFKKKPFGLPAEVKNWSGAAVQLATV